MNNVFAGAGWFLLPLGLCLVLAVYVMIERLLALRSSRVLPGSIIQAFLSGKVERIDVGGAQGKSVAGRIINFYRISRPEPDSLKAFSMLEIARLERGMFLIDVVVAAAPLIGLLGTVTGLIHVFGGIDVGSGGLPESNVLTQGIALALSTTMLGLIIAVPALLASGYLYRRVDILAAQLNVGVERLIDITLAAEAEEAAIAYASQQRTQGSAAAGAQGSGQGRSQDGDAAAAP